MNVQIPTSSTLPPPSVVPATTGLVPGAVVSTAPTRSGYRTVTWNKINIDTEILSGKPEPKTYESIGKDDFGNEVRETGTYFDIPVLYCPGGNPELVKPEHFYFEGPPMMSYGGITSRLQGSKKSYSLKLSFRSPGGMTSSDEPVYDDQAKEFKEWFTKFWRKTGKFIENNKMQVKLPDFSAETDTYLRMCGYKNKVYTPTDDFTQIPLEEKSTMYVRLLNWESTKDGSSDRTKFIGLDGNLIEWTVLQKNIVMALVPNFYIKKIYVSAKPSLQVKLKSVVVLWAKPIEQRLPQSDTVLRLKAAFPDMANSFKAQLLALESLTEESKSDDRSNSSDYSKGSMSTIGDGDISAPIATDTAI